MKTSTEIKKALLTSKQKSKKSTNSVETGSIKNEMKTAISAEELKKRTTVFLTSLVWEK